jgi:hypothetical protein
MEKDRRLEIVALHRGRGYHEVADLYLLIVATRRLHRSHQDWDSSKAKAINNDYQVTINPIHEEAGHRRCTIRH